MIKGGIASVGQVKPLKMKAGVEMTINNSVAFNWLGMAMENNIPTQIEAKVKSKVNTNIGRLKISTVILKNGKNAAIIIHIKGSIIKNGVAFNKIRYKDDF